MNWNIFSHSHIFQGEIRNFHNLQQYNKCQVKIYLCCLTGGRVSHHTPSLTVHSKPFPSFYIQRWTRCCCVLVHVNLSLFPPIRIAALSPTTTSMLGKLAATSRNTCKYHEACSKLMLTFAKIMLTTTLSLESCLFVTRTVTMLCFQKNHNR